MMELINAAYQLSLAIAERIIARILLFLCLLISSATFASDHADTSRIIELGRHDARIADFYAFIEAEKLILIMTLNFSGNKQCQLHLKNDVIYRFHIDYDSQVATRKPTPDELYEHRILQPNSIQEDITIELQANVQTGIFDIRSSGIPIKEQTNLELFVGPRDDPFIRSVVKGKNVGAIAVSVPVKEIVKQGQQSIILTWATTDLVGEGEEIDEHMGRPYRSQLPEFEVLNTHHPRDHQALVNGPPDVIIFDTAKPAIFPNGRALMDDVVRMLNRIPPNDIHPIRNDVPFMDTFPYLANPHINAKGECINE